jgi:hypothetical protein
MGIAHGTGLGHGGATPLARGSRGAESNGALAAAGKGSTLPSWGSPFRCLPEPEQSMVAAIVSASGVCARRIPTDETGPFPEFLCGIGWFIVPLDSLTCPCPSSRGRDTQTKQRGSRGCPASIMHAGAFLALPSPCSLPCSASASCASGAFAHLFVPLLGVTYHAREDVRKEIPWPSTND